MLLPVEAKATALAAAIVLLLAEAKATASAAAIVLLLAEAKATALAAIVPQAATGRAGSRAATGCQAEPAAGPAEAELNVLGAGTFHAAGAEAVTLLAAAVPAVTTDPTLALPAAAGPPA